MAGRYKAYPEYKDSGVEWLDAMPIHWQVQPLKFMTSSKVTDGPHETPKFIDEGIPFLSVDGIQDNKLVFEGCRYISIDDHKRFSLKCLPRKGDVLLGKAASVGKVAYADRDIDFNVWSPLAVISPKSYSVGKYLYYSFQSVSLQAQCEVFSNSNTQKNLSMGVIDNLLFSVPPDDEAINIANFLDSEITKIDALIEKQQQLIQLLKEKRQTVISHAVTKGFNPHASMRDSNIDWLGKVPCEWGVIKIKYKTQLFEQGWSPQCESRQAEEGEFGVLKVGCVNYGCFNVAENKALPKELMPQMQYLIRQGDLLISRANTKELVGGAAVVDREYENILLCDKLYRLRFDGSINPRWVAYYLSVPVVRQQIELGASGASYSMQNIGQSVIKELSVVVPPHEIVERLLVELDEKVEKFEQILNQSDEQIKLLQERRSALISAAVTGKIDVRDWVAPADNPDNKEVVA